MNSLDTNIVPRYLLNDIPEQAEKVRTIIESSGCYITDVVAAEAVFVLERVIELDRQDIVRLLKSFLSLPNMIYNDYFLDQTLELYEEQSSLSIVDCYATTEAKVYKNYLLSFDKDLIKHGGSHVVGL